VVKVGQLNKSNNISEIVKEDICTGCGACVPICPQKAITLKHDVNKGTFLPQINSAKCTSCGVCLKLCPGFEVDFDSLNEYFFSKKPSSLLGNYIECYAGHSDNESFRDNVSSGGIATELLIFALKSKIIDGALVTRFNKEHPLNPEPFLAFTVEDVISAAGSKYCPSPTNLGLTEIMHKTGKFCVVGLPCHIQAIRKAQLLLPALREKIVLTIGLFCAHTTIFSGTDVLLGKMKLDKDRIAKFAYRGHGWPGFLSAETTYGDVIKVPYSGSFKAYYPLFDTSFFVPWRCMFCPDHFNQLADISTGDAWLPEFKGSSVGQSFFIVRSITAQNLVQDAISSNVIVANKTDPNKVIKSQHDALRFKNNELAIRLRLANKLEKTVPKCKIDSGPISFGSFCVNAYWLYAMNLRKYGFVQSLVAALPLWFFRIHNIFLSFMRKML
jgi:coenzyme F420 hydrogenase subunit beta